MRWATVVSIAFVALVTFGQTPAPPAPLISAYYSLDNGATYGYRWVTVDAPLTFVLDSTGRPHLGIAPPAPPAAPHAVYDEAPAAQPNGTWTLAHAPLSGQRCFRNGLAQTVNATMGLGTPAAPQIAADFSIAGNIITSAFWQASDTLNCDYQY